MKKKIITLLTITIIITLSLIFEKNAKERYRVDTNNSFNKNNTNIIYSAGTFKINPFNINEAVEEVDYIFHGDCLNLYKDIEFIMLVEVIGALFQR